MDKPLQVLLLGASGRMGREIVLSSERSFGGKHPVQIAGGVVSAGSPLVGKSIPGIRLPLQTGWDPAFGEIDVIVDFSSEKGALLGLEVAEAKKIPMLLASTGLSESTLARAKAVSQSVPILLSANTSLVVTVMCKLLREAATMLREGFDVELMEIHHRHKKDAPSGTALLLLEEVAKAQGKSLSEVLEAGRHGHDATRTPESLGAGSLRGGDVAGEHTVYFFGEGERLEITQRASSRRVFADGALRGALWLSEQKSRGPGLFSMEDVLTP